MADQRRTSTRRPVFKRYSALEVLEEVLNDNDSGDEDFQGSDNSDIDDDELDNNQHHPLLSELVADDVADPDFEPRDDEEESESQHDSDHAEELEAIPSTSTAPPPVMRSW